MAPVDRTRTLDLGWEWPGHLGQCVPGLIFSRGGARTRVRVELAVAGSLTPGAGMARSNMGKSGVSDPGYIDAQAASPLN